ncbi:helix-turn-helix transcriptional regulator [Rhodobacter capsulatus]|uniref:helix-turn-helix transcriptional regulator n=1 Tax=Rhodobacter capsulatus TaxID=1061 RepID=UPI0040278B50
MTNRKYITRTELCEMLQISKETLSRWHRVGIAPPVVKIEQTTRYDIDQVNAWMDAKTKTGEQK